MNELIHESSQERVFRRRLPAIHSGNASKLNIFDLNNRPRLSGRIRMKNIPRLPISRALQG